MQVIQAKSPAYFLSDCHLPLLPNPAQDGWSDRVISFLQSIQDEAKTLFLVGDIFDFWFEWRHVVPARAFPVLHELRKLVDTGVEVHYIAGNHDGHVGDFLRDQVGLKPTRKSLLVEMDGKKFYLLHGDGVAPDDYRYRMLRTMVRWKPTEAIYRLLHPDFGIWFAGQVSRFSNYSEVHKDPEKDKQYIAFGERIVKKDYDYIVMGHMHKSAEIRTERGGFFAIGDWIDSGSYGVFKDGQFEMRYYE